MMHFFVKSIESRSRSTYEEAAMLQHRVAALDYVAGLYNAGRLGFHFRDSEGVTSYELHRCDNLLELDARLKSNPQWAYCNHQVIPVTKTGDMVRELTNYLKIDANEFFRKTLAQYREKELLAGVTLEAISKKVEANGGDFLALMSEDEQPIDEAGNYTLAAKTQTDVASTVSIDQLQDVWIRALRSQVIHLNSDIELVDYNPVGISQGLVIGRGDPEVIRRHIESTEIFPDTTVHYTPLRTSTQSGAATVERLRTLKRNVPEVKFLRLS